MIKRCTKACIEGVQELIINSVKDIIRRSRSDQEKQLLQIKEEIVTNSNKTISSIEESHRDTVNTVKRTTEMGMKEIDSTDAMMLKKINELTGDMSKTKELMNSLLKNPPLRGEPNSNRNEIKPKQGNSSRENFLVNPQLKRRQKRLRDASSCEFISNK